MNKRQRKKRNKKRFIVRCIHCDCELGAVESAEKLEEIISECLGCRDYY